MGEKLLAADSWLSVDGRVAGLSLHAERFAAAALHYGVSAETAREAVHRAQEKTPKDGEYFPRVVLNADGFFREVRPAPARLTTAALATAGYDPRTVPEIKGPDLVRLGALRAEVAETGANEAVILAGGIIVDCAYSAICWWRGDVLCAPPAELPRTRSVTWQLVQEIASARGVEVREESARPQDLDGCEVWVLSALHGIRLVTAWVDAAPPHTNQASHANLTLQTDSARRDVWQAAWESLRA